MCLSNENSTQIQDSISYLVPPHKFGSKKHQDKTLKADLRAPRGIIGNQSSLTPLTETFIRAAPSAAELQERLAKANTANEKLREEIETLRQRYQSDPDFEQVLARAEQVLAEHNSAGYHEVLARFSERRQAKLAQY